MGGIDVTELLTVAGFIGALYASGWVFENVLQISPILGEILIGVVLGREVAGLLSRNNEEFLELLGYMGVTMMIFENGMHISLDKLKVVWKRSTLIAALGTALPMLSGLLFVYAAYGSDGPSLQHLGIPSVPSTTATLSQTITLPNQQPIIINTGGSSGGVLCDDCIEDETQQLYPDGFSLGCALAPTSVGIALKMLTESKQLDSIFGQTIITSAFFDDIFSVITLIILGELAGGDTHAWVIIKPLLLSLAFLVVGAYIGFKYFPLVIRKITLSFPESDRSFHPAHQTLLVLMFGVLTLYAWVTKLIGSHLLGAFVAGMSFSTVPRSHQVWGRQMKRINRWLIRLFFGSVIAFSIPVDDMFSAKSFYMGLLCGIGPCILSKVVSGAPAQYGYRAVVGVAMVGRGEFAFYFAKTAHSEDYITGPVGPYGKMMSNEVYAICIWALIWATVCAPFSFQYCLGQLAAAKAKERAKSGKPQVFSFRLKVKGQYVPFIVHDVLAALKEMNLVADNSNVETDGSVFIMTTTVQTKTQTPNDDLDDEAFHTIRHHLYEVLNDEDGQVMMVPIIMKRAVQLGELKLFNSEGEQIDLTKCTASNPGGDNPSAAQGPEGALKPGEENRWVDRNSQPLIVEFPTPTLVGKYSFKTAKDFADAAVEPVSWTLEGLPDANSEGWLLIDVQEGVKTTTERNAEIAAITLEEPLLWHSIRFVPKQLPDEGGEASDVTHVAGQRFRPGIHYTQDFEDEAHYVVIKVMGEHKMEFIVQMYNILQTLKLDIHKAKMYQTHSAGSDEPMSIKVLYCKDIMTGSGRPSQERLSEIRNRLNGQFASHGIKGKAMVKTLRCENAPMIYGFTPAVQEGEHVGEFVFVYKHPRTTKSNVWCPLTAVLAWMHTELHFDIINLAMDIDIGSKNDHVTIFVKDPEFSKHSSQENIVADLIDIFKEKGVPSHVSAHLHEWHVDQNRVTTNLGEAKDGTTTFAKITERLPSNAHASVLSFQGEAINLSSQNASQTLADDRFATIHATLEQLRARVNKDVDAAVTDILRPLDTSPPARGTKPY
eukprot:TRINITY_DN4514_c0_g1_i1.p1 TRINITY_DN4514_c0_g1~~TRINITY_DN4514_c0_g1_i1.p1  ORF type:complete len:1052 (+),score=175.76 TRINITY_DN4514_c0_g1_i1:70-3225(+)